jgi:hypothetical protein
LSRRNISIIESNCKQNYTRPQNTKGTPKRKNWMLSKLLENIRGPTVPLPHGSTNATSAYYYSTKMVLQTTLPYHKRDPPKETPVSRLDKTTTTCIDMLSPSARESQLFQVIPSSCDPCQHFTFWYISGGPQSRSILLDGTKPWPSLS